VLNVEHCPETRWNGPTIPFDRLEGETRRLGDADSALGSEPARGLTGRGAGRGVQGPFNTVIKEIDYEVAKILGLEDTVEYVRALVVELARRRLGRAGEVRPGALRGSAERVELKRPKGGKRSRGEPPTTRLDEFLHG